MKHDQLVLCYSRSEYSSKLMFLNPLRKYVVLLVPNLANRFELQPCVIGPLCVMLHIVAREANLHIRVDGNVKNWAQNSTRTLGT